MPKKRTRSPKRRVPKRSIPRDRSCSGCGILRKQLDMVRQVAGGMRKGMAYYEIMKLVLRSISQVVPCDRLSILLLDEKEKFLAREIQMDAHSHFETGRLSRIPVREAGGDEFSDLVFKNKPAGTTTKGRGDFPFAAKVPLETSGRVVGVLVAERTSTKRAFTGDDVETLLTFTTQAGFVLENIRLHYEMVQLAFKDELTGQYNHRFFIKRLREEVDRSVRYQHSFTVLVAGLDRFESFNDHYGFTLGDLALKEWGRYLRRTLRACDLVARIGGDKFGILLPETPPQGVQVVVDKLIKAAASFEFTEDPALKQIKDRFTVSVGAAEFPTNGLMLEQIMDRAHRALDEAKRLGGNQFAATLEHVAEDR